MKRKLEDYTFSKSELRILKELAKGTHSFQEIWKTIAIKPPLLSYSLKKLSRKGIIRTTKRGYRKYTYFNDSKHASLIRDLLLIYDYVNWENLLPGSAIEILFQILNKPERNLKDFSKATLWRHLRNLRAHGILKRDNHGYVISSRFSILADFLTEYQRFLVATAVKSISESAVILWQKDLECLLRVPKSVDFHQENFYKTATSCFYELGIPLISDFNVYFYSKTKQRIRIEDILLHTLLIEPNNVRYTLYGLLLLKKFWNKIDKKYLLKESQKYNLNPQVNGMLQFLETHKSQKDVALPSWEEFVAKAKEYKVI
jgi:DNA-binding HxlR family transcriptional regulator